MGGLGNFFSDPPNSILIWTPILFFAAIVFLLWRTIQLMPRVKPAPIEAQSARHRSGGPTSRGSTR